MSAVKEALEKMGVELPQNGNSNDGNPEPPNGNNSGVDGGADDAPPPDLPSNDNNGGNHTDPTPPSIDGLTEDQVMEFLKKRNPNITNLDSLIAPPELLSPEQEAEKREAESRNIMMFGLQSGKIKDENEYRSYITDTTKSAEEIAFEIFSAEEKERDPNITEQELEDEFQSQYFLHLNAEDPKRIRAQKNMENLRQRYINDKYKGYVGLENEYHNWKQEDKSEKDYLSFVNDESSAVVPNWDYEFDFDDKKYNYKVGFTPDEIAAMAQQFKTRESYELFKTGNLKKGDVSSMILNSLVQQNMQKVIKEIATAHASAVLADAKLGRRNRLPERSEPGGEGLGGSKDNRNPAVAAALKNLKS